MRQGLGFFQSGGFSTIEQAVYTCACRSAIQNTSSVCERITQVVHKKMPERLPVSRDAAGLTLLLLAGSVEYLRDTKYSGLASLVTQDSEAGKLRMAMEEEEYLRVAVERILKQKPDVMLLGGFMAKSGLDRLRNAGVTVVLNVKQRGVHAHPWQAGCDA